MAEEMPYHDGDIVWVKMNKLWWPGEVHASHRLPSDFFDQFKKPPLVVVKFFQEQNYHYVNQLHQIARFNCAKKNEFIKKGLDLFYAKHSYMVEFPADVAIAEKRTGGNPNILHSKEFLPITKPDKTTPISASKGSTSRSRRGQPIQSNVPSIPRVMIKPDHDTRIMVPIVPAGTTPGPSSTPTAAYKCNLCKYSTNRINTLIWHQKNHSSPKTPQVSATTQKFSTKKTPSTSTASPDDTKLPSSEKLQSEDRSENNVLEIEETSKPVDELEEPVDRASEPVAEEAEPVVVPEKSKGKRPRRANESRPKVAEKVPKTDNKLRNILDDWSDDEVGEAGPSGLNENVNCIVLDTDNDQDDVKEECSVKKKLKFGDDKTNDSNGSQENESDLVSDDLSSKIKGSVPSSASDVKIENKPKFGGKKSAKDETVIQQSPTKDVPNDEPKTQTRFSLRSGRITLTNETSTASPILPKRRGRAKRNTADDSLKSEAATEEIKESAIEPILPEKTVEETSSETSAGDKVSEESINPASVQAKAVNKSNSKTSRKGKPRRKEEIKLANNISVAVLVEKTHSSPSISSTDKGSEQKVDLPADDDEFTNVVHKKIRYMSHSSVDDYRKSSESIEAPKLPEPTTESINHSENRMEEEPSNHTENDVEMTTDEIQSSDQNDANNTNDVPKVSEHTNLDEKSVANLDDDSPESTEKIKEISTVIAESQKCYKRNDVPTKCVDVTMPSPTSFTESIVVDKYESPSSSNLRQRAPKRYENTRNRRRGDRRTTSDDEFAAMVKEIDDNCERIDRARQKSVDSNNSPSEDNSKVSEILNGSGKDGADSTNPFDQSSETSNSKTSTPEKTDTSKELDCFDFTEDECVKPQVLNRRKRLPPAKVFELEDIDQIEEQRKIDEETTRVAQQREDENQKLHTELENLLNSTTPVTLPEIPVTPKVHENFPERRAEKDPEKIPVKECDVKERMLPPKERNKRIFKYRNRNRRPDSDVTVGCVIDETMGNSSLQAARSDENSSRKSVDEMEVEQKLPSNDQTTDTDKDPNPSAHDLQIEIAETLINFPLLSPQIGCEQSAEKAVTKLPAKRKESAKTAVNKLRKVATVATPSKIVPEVLREETTITKESTDPFVGNKNNSDSCVLQINKPPATIPSSNPDNLTLQTKLNESNDKHLQVGLITKTTEADTVAASTTIKPTASSSVRDFSRIRLIEKLDNHSPVQATVDEVAPLKIHQLPLKKTVILTQTEGTSFINRIPKKRKSQMDDDIPAFVIERPKDHPDDASESNTEQTLTKKEPKSFIVTKTLQKQITGELPKPDTSNAGSGVHPNPNEVMNDNIERTKNLKGSNSSANTTPSTDPISSPMTQIPGSSEISSIASPVIMTSHLTINKRLPTTNAQKRAAPTAANVLGSLSANRPCTIAPAKKASYRKPTDMTGLTQKQIGIDGKGNPVMIYTKITPVVTQTPPVITQSTFVRNEPIASSSQSVQSFSPSLQSNQGNQFVITSKGALITNKPFITTTHTTQLNQPTLTNRSNIQVHSQLIRSHSPQVFQKQQQLQQHSSPQSNQIIIQTKSTNLLSQISSLAPTPVKKQPTNRRSVVNKICVTEIAAPEPSNERLANSSGYANTMNEDNGTFKKRIVRRISKNPSPAATQSNQQQQVILNSEINHIGSAPIPPLIPLSDQSTSRKQLTKPQQQPHPNQMTLMQEPQVQSKTMDVVEQQQENIQEILALPGDTPGFGGPPGSYFLCKLNDMGVYVPIDHQPLYLDMTDNTNLLKPNAPDGTIITEAVTEIQTDIPQQSSLYELNNETERVVAANQSILSDPDANNPKYLINISDGQQLLVDQQSLMALANGEEFPQFVTSDGHQIILQSGQHDILSAIAFAEDVGLIAGQQILIPEDDLAVIQSQGGNHDILAAALAGTEAFSQEQFIDNVLIRSTNGIEDIVDPMVYHTMPQTTLPPVPLTNAVTNETNAVLTQPPIMSTLEHPTKTDRISPNNSLELMSQNLDESLAVIGVTNVPTSLELPITITNPAIAPKTTSMSAIYPSTVTTEHDLDYDLFSSSLPISHHLTQSLATNENYRTVNVINSIGDVDSDSNVVAVTASTGHRFVERN